MYIHDKNIKMIMFSFIINNTLAWWAYFNRFISPRIHYTVVFEWSTRVCYASTTLLFSCLIPFPCCFRTGMYYFIFAPYFLYSLSAFTNIFNWTLTSYYLMETSIQCRLHRYGNMYRHLKTLADQISYTVHQLLYDYKMTKNSMN